MSFNVTNRLQQLQDFKTFGSECEKSINNIFEELNWNQNYLNKSEPMVLCPFDSNHRMSCHSIDKHLEKCELKASGYTNEDIESVALSTAFYYERSPHIKPVVIDKQIERKILGEPIDVGFSSDRFGIELTARQRLALYDYVILTNKNDSKSSDTSKREDHSLLSVDLFEELNKKVTQTQDQSLMSSKLEVLAMNRDNKRRRQSYRSKNVHTRGKSYSQIVGNVIENYCKALQTESQESHEIRTHRKSHKHKHKSKSEHKNRSEHNERERTHKSKHRHKHKYDKH